MKMNKLNDDKTKLIGLQQQQISDLNNLYSLAERNISVLNDEIKVQKKKKVKTFIVTALGTALVTTTGVLLLTK